MPRNRIVINLDQARAAGRKSGGGIGRVLLVIAVILLLIVGALGAGGYFWWRHYQTSPGYSLALLADAAQRNDTQTMDSILDYDSISKTLVDQVKSGSGSLMPGSQWLNKQLSSLTSSLPNSAKQEVQTQARAEARRISERAAGKPFIAVALAMNYYADIKQDGDAARASLNLPDEQIELTMKRQDDRWRVIGVRDDNLTRLLGK